MSFNKQIIIDEFLLKSFGVRGWMRSDLLICPSCGQNDEFAIKFTDNGGVMHCLHSKSCNNYSSSLYTYLRGVDKLDLIEFERLIDFDVFPDFSEFNEVVEEEKGSLPFKKLPIGFKRLEFDEYLNSRGFFPKHYELFQVGYTRLDPSLREHLVFQFFNEGGECIGWMSRSKKDKKWHDENLKKFKAGLCNLQLRYNNSHSTDFGKILGGYNEITRNTDTLIIVEGIMDKVNVDAKLGLLCGEGMKCCFTFGNKISIDQIGLINKFSNIKNIYLLYDGGTIKQSKQCGLFILSNTGKNVRVCDIKQKDFDPGDMDAVQLVESLEQSVDGFEFNYNKVDEI